MRIFHEPQAKETLAVFRIVLGVLALIQAIWTLPSLHTLYGMKGFLSADLMRSVPGWSLTHLANSFKLIASQYENFVSVVTLLNILFIIPFIFGVFYRFSAVVLWLTHTFYMNSGQMSVYGANRYLHLFFFLSVILPLADAYAWGKPNMEKEKNGDYTVSLWILRGAFAITYFHSGFSKSFGADWWSGDAIWRAVNMPEFRQYDLFWTSKYGFLYKLLCRGTLFFEVFYPVAILFRSVRKYWLLVMMQMHLGIALLLGLHFFAFEMILFNLSLFIFDFLPEVRNKQSLVPSHSVSLT